MVKALENVTNYTPEDHSELSDLEIKRLNFPRWGHTTFAVLLLFVEIFGFIEICLILFTFYKSKHLRSATNIFVISLCVADLCMIILGCPFSVISAFQGKWAFSENICVLSGFIVYFFGLTQLYLLVVISVDRYIVITKPLQSALITKRIAILSCSGCYVGGFFWAVLPLAGWSQYGLEAPGVFCGLDIENTQFSYSLTIFFTCFLIPFTIMCFCYYRIYSTIRNVNKTMVWDMNSRVARRNLKLEKKMMRSCILMCCSYWICWFPYALVFFWQVLFGVDSLPLVVTEIPALTAKSQGVLNPLIYGATNKMFRQSFYNCLPCKRLREILVKREEENSQHSVESESENEPKREVTKLKNANVQNPNAVGPIDSQAPTNSEC